MVCHHHYPMHLSLIQIWMSRSLGIARQPASQPDRYLAPYPFKCPPVRVPLLVCYLKIFFSDTYIPTSNWLTVTLARIGDQSPVWLSVWLS